MKFISFGLVVIVLTVFLCGDALQNSGCWDCDDCFLYAPGSRDYCFAHCGQPCQGGKSLQRSDKREQAQADHFCKLGCVTSVCSAITTTTLPTGEEDVKGAVDRCNNGCSKICTKRFGGSAALSA